MKSYTVLQCPTFRFYVRDNCGPKQWPFLAPAMTWIENKVPPLNEVRINTLFLFIRTFFYKNVEAEVCLKFKNILRKLPRLRVG